MNSNIIEIVTILVQKLLHDEDVKENEEEIIQGLIDLGYDLKEIEIAFELIFSSAEIIGISDTFENLKYLPTSARVLSLRERFAFTEEAQRILIELLDKKLLTDGELEDVIQRASSLLSMEAGSNELWYLLKTAVRDRMVLARIKHHIPVFKIIQDGENLFAH